MLSPCRPKGRRGVYFLHKEADMEEQIVQEDIVKAAQEEAEKAEGSRALYEVKMKL